MINEELYMSKNISNAREKDGNYVHFLGYEIKKRVKQLLNDYM